MEDVSVLRAVTGLPSTAPIGISEQVPNHLPTNLIELNLRMNNISSIDQTSFSGCEHLQSLDLSSNQLFWIDPDAFRSMSNLQELRVHDNQLSLNSSDSFEFLISINNSLRVLAIQNNTARNDDLFTHLVLLEHLSVDGGWGDEYGEGFLDLVNLEYVDCSS